MYQADVDRVEEFRKEPVQHHQMPHRVCPEHIYIADNGIIPTKERGVDRYFDPIKMITRAIKGEKVRTQPASGGEGRGPLTPELLQDSPL